MDNADFTNLGRLMSGRFSNSFGAAILFAALGAILFSAKAIVVKLSYQHGADAVSVLALRMLFSLPFFWVAMWWHYRTQSPARIGRRDLLAMIFLGFIGYYVSSYFDFLGLQYISVGLERIILYLTPAIVLVLSAVIFKKTITTRQWVAMAVAYAGVILVFLHDVRWEGQQVVLGSFFVFMGAATYAVYLLFAGEIVSRVGSLRLVAFASGSSTVFSLIHALLISPEALVTQSAAVYGLSLFNASFCTFAPMLLIMIAVNRIGPGFAAQASVVGPVATVFLGWFFLGERVSLTQLLGIAIVLISMWLLLTAKKSDKTEPPHQD